MNSTSEKLVFMSRQHVELMNRILDGDAASRAACAALARPYTLAYELAEDDATVWWTMHFDPQRGVYFGLEAPGAPADLTYHGDHREVLRTMLRIKAGEPVALPLTETGDAGLMDVIGAAFAAARDVATIDTKIPVV